MPKVKLDGYGLEHLIAIRLYIFEQIECLNNTTERDPNTVSYLFRHYKDELDRIDAEIKRR